MAVLAQLWLKKKKPGEKYYPLESYSEEPLLASPPPTPPTKNPTTNKHVNEDFEKHVMD